MDISKFSKQKTGELIPITGIPGATHSFVPDPFPMKWDFPVALYDLLIEARSSLSHLDGIGRHLPNPHLLLRPLQNREAQKSSSLEGTVTQPEQQMLFEADPRLSDGHDDSLQQYFEVFNYRRALSYGSEETKLPLSLRLIRDLHKILMTNVRGSEYTPGEFRRNQNQVGRPPRYVPPPPNYLMGCLANLEKYFHDNRKYDPLVDAFIVHYQFEAIHPFCDGNGRIGRLLLALTIKEWCSLSNQWLYMSAYFDNHKDRYIDYMFEISTEGKWEEWIRFCLEGVISQTKDAEVRCEKFIALSQDYSHRIEKIRGSNRLNLINNSLFNNPVVLIPELANRFGVTYPTSKSDVEKLIEAGILHELDNTDQRTFFAPEIFRITYED